MNFQTKICRATSSKSFSAAYFARLTFFLTLLVCTASFAITVRPELKKFQDELEAQVQGKVNTFFGNESKIIVNIRVKEKSPESGGKDRDPNALDLGYIPIPLTPESKSGENARPIRVQSVEVDLQVPSDIEPPVLASAQDLVQRSLREYDPKIFVTKGVRPKKESDQDQNKPEEKKPEKKDDKNLLPFIATLAAAIILCIGILFIARALVAAANALAEGLRGALSGGKEKQVIQEILPEEPEKGKDRPQEKPITALRDYTRNIRVIKEILRENPSLFAQELRDNDEDLRGLKWILPALDKEEQENLRLFLGTKRLVELSKIEKPKETEGEDYGPMKWVQSFVERLILRKLQGNSLIEASLGQEHTVTFMLSDPKTLVESARSVGDLGAWRILAEILPKDRLEKLLDEVDDREWQALIAAGDTSQEELQNAASKMMEKMKTNPRERVREEQRTKYYASVLLEPVVNSVLNREPRNQDPFLDKIGAFAPDFVGLIREKVWTPRELDRVPNDYLGKALRQLTNEQKAALIAGLPTDQAQRIERLLPEGNVKIIVQDQVRKLQSKQGGSSTSAAISKMFLDMLRLDAREKKFSQVSTPPSFSSLTKEVA